MLQSKKPLQLSLLTLKLMVHRNFSLEAIHVTGAKRIAEAVAKYDIDRFIHISSSSINEGSSSEFLRTKVSTLHKYFIMPGL